MWQPVSIVLVGSLTIFTLVKSGNSQSHQKSAGECKTLSLESFEVELAAALEREKVAKQGIAQEQASIESVKQNLEKVSQSIASAIKEKYTIVGSSEQEVVEIIQKIGVLKQKLGHIAGCSGSELSQQVAIIHKAGTRINSLKSKPVADLWQMKGEIEGVESLIAKIEANLPPNPKPQAEKPESYTVKSLPNGKESLWRIAGYDSVYGDPSQWPRLYKANKMIIDDYFNSKDSIAQKSKYGHSSDLIKEGWILNIPR
jgi:nucleoid-associated protein YgaU